MNVGVIGYGFVGRATGEGFLTNPGNQVFWFDKFKESPNTLDEVVEKSEFIFISVPTPIFEDYSGMDMSIVEGVVDEVAPKLTGTGKILVIKSTSLPGTTQRLAEKYNGLHLVMNPEFLTQKNANRDFLNPSRTVLGVNTAAVGQKMIDLYKTILPADQKYFVMDFVTAEVVKYMSNLMLASKVLIANEFYDLSLKVGADYNKVQEAVEADPRIGNQLRVPGPDGSRGFGGACFPKDMVGILGLAKNLDVDMSALKAVWEKNLKIREARDWEEMPQAFKKK